MVSSSGSGIVMVSFIILCFMIFFGDAQGEKHDAAIKAALEEMDMKYTAERREQEGLFNCGTAMLEVADRTNEAAKKAGFSPERIREKAAEKFDRKAAAERYERIRAEEKRQEVEAKAKTKKAEELLRHD